MVYGAISEKDDQWYTQMGRVFEAIKNKQNDYNWLITDMDCVPQKLEEYRCGDYCWLTGEELSKIVSEDDRQWVWAVLSGFDKSIDLSEVLKCPHPYADGYRGFWINPILIQHPLATIEIVSWDGCLTLFFSKHEDMVKNFLSFFPFSEELSVYNAK